MLHVLKNCPTYKSVNSYAIPFHRLRPARLKMTVFSLKNTGRNIMWYVIKVPKVTASGPISAKSLKALKYNGQYIMIASRYINTDALVPWSSILSTSFILICMVFCRRGLGQEEKKWGRYQIIIFSRHLALCFMSSFYCKNLLL